MGASTLVRNAAGRWFLENLETRRLLAAVVTTDKLDYSPGSTAYITASNNASAGTDFAAGETIEFQVLRADGLDNTPPGHEPWRVTDGVGGFTPYQDASGTWWAPDLDGQIDGGIGTSWYVHEQFLGATLQLTATGLGSGAVARTTFTDGAVKVRTNSSGVTFELDYTVYDSSNGTGTVVENDVDPPLEQVGFSGGAIYNKGVSENHSIRLTAPAVSDQGGQFLGWSGETASDTFITVPGDPFSIIVPGNFTGNRTYIANYGAPNSAPTVTAANSSVTVNEGSPATNSGTYNDVNALQNVAISASIGTVTKTGTNSGTWSWSYTPADGPLSQTVTITANDGNGGTASTTFQLNVNNVAPSVVRDSATVTVNEGQTATNTGTWSDPGDDVVTLTASVGAVAKNADGTWSWSYATADGPDNSQTVTITATDSDGAAASTTFALVVNNVAPSVAANNGTVIVNEGATAANTGTWSDVGADVVALTASAGTVVQNANGTWSWSLATDDGPDDGQTITITATDSDGASSSTTFSLVVNNVAPTVTLVGPAAASEGDTKHYTFTTSDPGDDTFPSFVVQGGTVGTVSNVVYNTSTGAGSFDVTFSDGPASSNVLVQVTDTDGATSNISSVNVAVANVAPAVAANNATVTVNEGQTALNSGTWSDPGVDVVTLSASVGAITKNANGTWSWSFAATDGSDQSQTVTITAADSDGASTSTTFALVVNNVTPSVAANNASVIVNEGATAANTGTWSDPGNDDVTLTASVGTVVKNANGTWSWSLGTTDGPDDSATVTITATDSDGAASSTSFSLTVNNVAPTVTLIGPAGANEGETKHYTFTTTDPGNDTFPSFTVQGGAVGTVSNVAYDPNTGAGSFDVTFSDGPASSNVLVQVTDSDGAASNISSFDVAVANVAPSVAANQAIVTVDEGQTALNSGTWSDPGVDVVTLSASVGTVTKDADGTWNWSFATTDGPADGQSVTITATDSDGAATGTTFQLVVNNVAPSVARDQATVTVDEGQTASNTGTWSDPGNDVVTLTASAGVIVKNANGTWSWSFASTDGPDDSQMITVTATDSDGASSTTTFALVVNNVAPSVAANQASVTVDEGQTAGNTGTWSDPGIDVVTLTASVGTVTQNADGTWSWSHATTDGPDDSQTVTITATDSDGASTSTTFALVVNNVAPSVAATLATVTVNEAATATNSGTWSDPGNDGVTLDASVGTIVRNADGTWSWSFATTDGPDDSQTVTITATDSDGATTTTTFALVVNNVAPSVARDNATITVNEGQTASNTGTWSDPGADVVELTASVGTVVKNANGTWSWSFGTTDGPDDTQTVTITATDSDGAATGTTFQLVVNNVAPSIAAGHATVMVNEGQTAANTGTWSDPGTDVVTLTASVGTVTKNADGTWSWSLTTTDGPDNSQTVTVTATDSDGAATAMTFSLVVNNVAPSVEAINATVTVNEGQTAVNSGTWSDPGADVVTLTASVGTITKNADGTWNWSYATTDGPDDSQTVTVTATDSDGASTSTSFALVVNNVAPQNVSGGADQTVNEADTVNLSGTFTDPGDDTHTFAWQVSASSGQVIADGTGQSFSFTPNDNGTYTVTFTVTDSDGAATSDTVIVTANNVAPTATNNAYATSQGVFVGGNVITDNTGGGVDSDPAGANDPLVVFAHTPPANGVLTVNADGSFTYQPHTTFSGTDSFTYTISDGDGGFDTATVTITVAPVASGSVVAVADTCLGGTALLINGTSAGDHIVVEPGSASGTIKVTINGVSSTHAAPSGRIIVFGGAGDDNVQIAGSVTNVAWLYGEAGNDRLFGGGGASLLLGGDGNDQLTGGSGRDIEIGGNGSDQLIGNSGDDILVAGFTNYDSRFSAGHESFFCGIMHEWNSSNAFMTRVNNLRNGTGGNAHNGGSFLNDGTIQDDNDYDAVDLLNGSSGNDWLIFTKGEDKVVGQVEASDGNIL